MPWPKSHDLAVVTGTYQKNGEEKKRYLNVGKVLTNSQDGGQMYFISRAFSPAGIPPRDPNDDSILVYKFEVKEKPIEDAGKSKAPEHGKNKPINQNLSDKDDDIPF